jgi:hypothetical protein
MHKEDSNPRSFEPDAAIEAIRSELSVEKTSKRRRVAGKFFVAALGAIPWVGGFFAAAAEIRAEEAEAKKDDLRTQWLEEHHRKLGQLAKTLGDVEKRFDCFGPEVEERIQSPEYLSLVRQGFRVWDSAETEQKRTFVTNLVANSAGTRICKDDVVRLFISWLDAFHEAHFAVIAEIHANPGSTRYDIWSAIYGDLPREDSAEADLYRMLIRDLSTGGVIRQARDTTEAGEFVRRRAPNRRGPVSGTLESSFEDSKPYVLTELGKKFVHYTLLSEIRRLEPKHE